MISIREIMYVIFPVTQWFAPLYKTVVLKLFDTKAQTEPLWQHCLLIDILKKLSLWFYNIPHLDSVMSGDINILHLSDLIVF